MAATMKALQLRQYMDLFLAKKTRADGRKFTEGRSLIISTNTIDTADGSSSVKLGSSSCLAGLKGAVIKIDSECVKVEDLVSIKIRLPATWDHMKHNHAYLADCASTASSLECKLIECLSACLDTQCLIVIPGKYAWRLELEVIFLDYDGNYEDLAFIAVSTCLLSSKLPEAIIKTSSGDDMSDTVQLQDEIIYSTSKFTKISLPQVPINCTFVELKNNFLLDGTSDEESLAGGCLSITQLFPSGEVISMSKVGGSPMHESSIPQLMQAANERCKYLHSNCLKSK